jgi:hypothetical protein
VLDTLAGSQSREDRGFFVEMALRNQDRDGFTDDFVGGVTENALRAFVPTRDDAFEGFTDDCVVCGVDQSGEPIRRELRVLRTPGFSG